MDKPVVSVGEPGDGGGCGGGGEVIGSSLGASTPPPPSRPLTLYSPQAFCSLPSTTAAFTGEGAA